jgi:hypothetical protein
MQQVKHYEYFYRQYKHYLDVQQSVMWHLLTISFYIFQFFSLRFIVILLFFATSLCQCLFSSVIW